MEKGLVFGLRCKELLASYDHDTQSWKTSLPSLFEDSIEFLDRLPTSGMMRNGRLYRLETLELPTYENEFGLLPTPRNNKVQCVTPNLANREKSNLEEWVAKMNFPTPCKMDSLPIKSKEAVEKSYKKNRMGREMHAKLGEVIAYPPPKIMFPTPTKSDGKFGIDLKTAERKANGENRPSGAKIGQSLKWFKPITDTYNGKGHLNPNLCEWLMGYPINWTALEPVEIQSSPKSQK